MPGLGQTRVNLYTLPQFRPERAKTLPCPAVHQSQYKFYWVYPHPPPPPPRLRDDDTNNGRVANYRSLCRTSYVRSLLYYYKSKPSLLIDRAN